MEDTSISPEFRLCSSTVNLSPDTTNTETREVSDTLAFAQERLSSSLTKTGIIPSFVVGPTSFHLLTRLNDTQELYLLFLDAPLIVLVSLSFYNGEWLIMHAGCF